jgi:uncharacterized protein YbjT (DUF2867 family)
MRVLVAGATGALGHEVVLALLSRGHQVRAIGRSAERLARLGNAETRIVDVENGDGLREAMTGVDAVFSSLGASVQPSLGRGRATYSKVDVPLNNNLIQIAIAVGRPRFVYTSVFRAPDFPNLIYMRAHEDVAALLKQSGLSHAVIRPTGFFSAYASFIEMAKKGPLPEMNGGAAKTNPIHDGDLAQVCADAIEGKTGDIDAGGPEVLTRRQIGELAFAAAGKPPRFRQTPPWLISTASKLMKPFHPRIADLADFLGVIMQGDFVAPVRGQRTLGAYFKEVGRKHAVTSVAR